MNELNKLEDEGTAALAAVERALHDVIDGIDRKLQAIFGSHPAIAETLSQAKKDVSDVIASPTATNAEDENPNPAPTDDPAPTNNDETPPAAT